MAEGARPSLPHRGGRQRGQELIVEFLDIGVRRLRKPPAELDRNSAARAGELALVKKAHSGQAKNDQSGGALFGWSQDGGDAGFVVVLQEMRAGSETLRREFEQMALNSRSIARHQAVIQRLVIGVIESQRLQPRLQTPIRLGKEEKSGVKLDDRDGRGPEFGNGRRRGNGKPLPGFGEDIVEYEHGHVATDAIATAGDDLQQPGHLARGSQPIIQLDGIRPGGEIRVFAVSQPPNARAGFLGKGLGDLCQALHEDFRLFADPRMIETKVIGHEVQHQFQPVLVELATELLEPVLPAQAGETRYSAIA